MKRLISCFMAALLMVGSTMSEFAVYAKRENVDSTSNQSTELLNTTDVLFEENGETFNEDPLVNNEQEGIETQSVQEEAVFQANENEENAPEDPESVLPSNDYPLLLSNIGVSVTDSVITINYAYQLILLSNCNPYEYMDYTLSMPVSGELNLTESTEFGGTEYFFLGLGSADYPFKGTLSGSGITLIIDHTLFNGLSSTAKLNNQNVEWRGDGSQPMLAQNYIFENNETVNFPINLKIADDNDPNKVYGYTPGTLIDTIQGENGLLQISDSSVDYNYSNNTNKIEISNSENAGLICNTMKAGRIELVDYAYPSSFSVDSPSGSVGGLVGKMDENTELTVINTNTVELSVSVSGNDNAGGLVGSSINSKMKFDNFKLTESISSNENSGGLVGALLDSEINFTNVVITTLTTNGLKSGGAFGLYSLSGKTDDPVNGVSFSNQIIVTGSDVAGGVFGILELKDNASINVGENDHTTLKVLLTGKILGGFAGQISGNGTANSLTLKNYAIEFSRNTTEDVSVLLGGVVGLLGDEGDSIKNATLVVGSVETKTDTPSISSADEHYFGGVVGRLDDGSVLCATNINVITTDNITRGGGVVGYAGHGSIVRLDGITDLSSTYYNESDKEGQIIGFQDSSLIYALGSGCDYDENTKIGWTLKRSTTPAALDDIGNYGEIIRLKASADSTQGLSSTLIQMDEISHVVLLDGSINYSNINNVDDFARLAITWQTKGYISGDSAVTKDNWEELNQKNIIITGAINLSGTGITGFTRDSDMESSYSGSLNGQNNTITLAIGESFGMRGDTVVSGESEGNGRIYRHSRLGLFSSVNGNVSNLTLDGTIKATVKNVMAIGSLSGNASGGHSIDNVKTNCNISVKTPNQIAGYVGGFYGAVEKGTGEVTIGNSSLVHESSSITVENGSILSHICVGGVAGYVNAGTSFQIDNLKISGTINDQSQVSDSFFLAGGLIGVINKENNIDEASITVKKILIEGFSLSTNVNEWTGGVLGAFWAKTNFQNNEECTEYAIEVKSGSINAPNTKYMAGLVYSAGGKWEFNNYALDVSGLTLSGGTTSTGIMIHDGYNSAMTNGFLKDVYPGAIYLLMKASWNDAYQVENNGQKYTQNNTPKYFDEFVARTAKENNIMVSNQNGVISLRTLGDTVTMDGTRINTYRNRTGVGKQTNPYSRYYYNLDILCDQITENNECIDTPQELMIWSVRTYAQEDLKKHFTKGDTDKWKIGSSNNTVTFDMTGYSYYPVDVYNQNLEIKNAIFEFYNEKIENGEILNNNKVTSEPTQHYAMHCGLIHDFKRYGSSSDTRKNCTLSVEKVSFKGTVGKLNDSTSGVLCSGSIEGVTDAVGAVIYSVSINDCVLDGIRVYDPTSNSGTAPLLINASGSYSSLILMNVKSIKDSYQNESGKLAVAGSSLIGTVGGEKATQVTITFANMDLQSNKNETIFSRASFMESFGFVVGGIGSATYNFNKSDKATYGAEIDDPGEYASTKQPQEPYYYDRDELVTDNKITASPSEKVFGKNYIPYINNRYVSESWKHDIKVNHRIINIIDGCGTYGHPYKITDAGQLMAIADYIEKGDAGAGWEITIASSQTELCNALIGGKSLDKKYKYDGMVWRNVDKNDDTFSNENMHMYIKNAYYDIQENITLKNFKGLGTKSNPFRGVLVSTSTEEKTITISQDNGMLSGLIPYSYGSVVKDLTINYTGENKLIFSSGDNISNGSFFGGVFGTILGGDNIIDNVQVSASDDYINFASDKKHLITVGGYIGSIAGGGVIFRNMNGQSGMMDSWIKGEDMSIAESANNSLYVNPYLGRMLDGYAFSEGCEINNTNKNYKINRIDPSQEKGVITTGLVRHNDTTNNNVATTTTVKTSQGLLILSAIFNSGAANATYLGQDTSTNAYYYGSKAAQYGRSLDTYEFGNKNSGKVRNANYREVGKPANAQNDFDIALQDDRLAPGYSNDNYWGTSDQITDDKANTANLPYLITKYSNKSTAYICSPGVSYWFLKFDKEVTLDLNQYGNGYLGLMPRYNTNAANAGTASNAYDRITQYLVCVDGGNAKISVGLDSKEYIDDEYHTLGLGALFSAVCFCDAGKLGTYSKTEGNRIRNLTIENSKMSLSYWDDKGNSKTINDITGDTSKYGNNFKKYVGVGGFAGLTKNYQNNYVAMISNFTVNNIEISSPQTAGSIFGNIGNAAHSTSKMYNFSANAMTPILVNCSYANSSIKGENNVGGFIGLVNASSDDGKDISVNVTKNINTGSNTTITSNGTSDQHNVGGVFGYVSRNVKINDQEYSIIADNLSLNYSNSGKELFDLQLDSVHINGGGNGGGIIGNYAPSTTSIINKVQLTNSKVQSKFFSGGVIGILKASANNANCAIADVKISATNWENSQIGSEKSDVTKNYYGYGGIIGSYYASEKTTNSSITLKNCTIDTIRINYNLYNGGLIGFVYNKSSITSIHDCAVKNSIIEGQNVGGIIGWMNKTLHGSNILISNNIIKDKDGQNLRPNNRSYLLGVNGTNLNPTEIYIAGLSVQRGEESNSIPVVGVQLNTNNTNPDKYNGYIAFADYNGSCLSNDGNASLLDKKQQKEPYVVTSPISSVEIQNGEDKQKLFGDGMAWKSESTTDEENQIKTIFTTNVEVIYQDSKNTSSPHFRYVNFNTDTPLIFSNIVSTYATEQNAVTQSNGITQPTTVSNDFPVLKVSGGDTTAIAEFINIITNGGYQKALEKYPTHMSVSVSQYKWNGTSFVKESGKKPALRVLGSGSSNVSFVTTSEYDNGLDRFNLVTVTFTEEGNTYQVHLPVIVRRLLEVDFSATLDYGTKFNASSFAELDSHVLESYGNSITAYLAYTYNYANGKKEEYGWQNYVDAGGNMLQILEKTIIFKQTTDLPTGTQLTLIDPETGKSYYYITNDQDSKNKEIPFDVFKDTGGNCFSSKPLCETMHLQVSDEAGKFVEEVDPAKATIYCQTETGLKYYRLANSDEVATHTVKIDEDSFTKELMTESYYLVITMPKGNVNPANGFITTKLSGNVPNNINCLKINGKKDGHDNTASTYNLSEGYQQELSDSFVPENEIYQKEMVAGESLISIHVTDTVSFPNSQLYNDTDSLYQRFIANIQRYIKQGGTDVVESAQFPSGSSGTVMFYVKANEQYWTGTELSDNETALTSYPWVSTGGNLELPLANEDGTLIDLAKLRKVLKGNQEIGLSTFTIEAIIDVHIPPAGLDVIPESLLDEQGQPKNYAKLAFTAQISNDVNTLSFSSTKVNTNGSMKYYRESAAGSKLVFNAVQIDQLGINLHDLQNDYLNAAKTASRIVTAVEYDLSETDNLEMLLNNSEKIVIDFDLRGRITDINDEFGLVYSENNYADAIEYINITSNSYSLSEQNGIWTMEIPKTEYIDEFGNVRTDGVFDGKSLKIQVDVWVRVDNIENNNHFYDNYKITCHAKLVSGESILDQPEPDNIIYTLCKIRPEMVFKQIMN